MVMVMVMVKARARARFYRRQAGLYKPGKLHWESHLLPVLVQDHRTVARGRPNTGPHWGVQGAGAPAKSLAKVMA